MDTRGVSGVLVVLWSIALSGGAALGAASVDDARLIVRGVQRGPGRQSVAIDAVVTPPPATRLVVTGTLTLGTIVVPVKATIGRSGRLTARAQRLDLASVLPDFGSAHLALPAPIDAVADFEASDCIARLRGHALACLETGSIPAPAPDGVYDVQLEGRVATALAELRTITSGGRGLTLVFSKYDSLSLTGTPDGALASLTGYSVTGGDILATASGSASSTHASGVSRVDGSATSAPFGSPSTWTFHLTRPDAGTPSALGGAWTVTFSGGGLMPFGGDAVLDVTVAADGDATTAPTTVVSGGSPLQSFDAGRCQIAPGGALSCSLPSPQLYGLRMHGRLDVASGTGSGGFYVGAPPSIYSDGTWSARR